ncbi:hypothetical protein [Embleya scabrispora]|uniref:hypothetical protein n=1 Tax=Embleya scabrispora TaxID=159449 RepID=UPI0003A1016D|nr:hypothetical protein [Embleya scabrispora]MYS84896.1 hypothetical protein [Streptomyces sp. SID5474]
MSVPAPRLILTLAVALFATTLTACGAEQDGADARAPVATGSPSAETIAQARRDAEQAADRWEADYAADKPRSLVIRGGMPIQVGNWESGNHAFKVALGDGCFAPPAPGVLPRTPVDGEVRWADGVVQRRPATAPLQGYGTSVPPELKSRCGTTQSPRLTVTSVSAATRTVQTTEGEATVPAWEIAFADTSVRVIGLAVTDDPWPDPGRPMQSVDTAIVAGDGRTLTVGFNGSPDGPGPCGSDYLPVAVQRDKVVAVAVVGISKPGPTVAEDGVRIACSTILASRTVTITLDAPLGNRALIGTAGLPLRPPPTRPTG